LKGPLYDDHAEVLQYAGKESWLLPTFGCCYRYIQSTCATSGEGLYEGLDWLSSNIANKTYAPQLFLKVWPF
jgi:hypothetical protein